MADGDFHKSGARLHERESDVHAAAQKLTGLLFEAQIRLIVSAPAAAEAAAIAKLQQMAGAFGIFHSPGLTSFHASSIRRCRTASRQRPARSCLLSTEELATIFHMPTTTVRAPTLAMVLSRELEPPVALPTLQEHRDLPIFGLATFRDRQQPFGILPDDRRRHILIEGKTGMGKTTLLHRLIASDIRSRRGVALIDPHGDLCDALLASVPPARTNDVVFFDAGDIEYAVAFNPLHCTDPRQRPLLASGVVSAFKKLYGEFWGPRMEHILRNAILALLEVKA